MSKILIPNASGKLGRQITEDYNEISLFEGDDVKIAKCEMWIAKRIGYALVAALPNREWGVRVDVLGGMVVITCDSLSTTKGYHLHLKNYTIEGLAEKAVKAGCEILERYNVSRDKKFDPGVIETLARDINDEAISADSAPIH